MNYYIGIDPGEKGCIISIEESENKKIEVSAQPLEKLVTSDTWNELKVFRYRLRMGDNVYCVIESQTPRPTYWKNKSTHKEESSILRSTVILYGNYMMLLGMLEASGIEYSTILPKQWQQWYLPEGRKKGETTSSWKNRLKKKAQELYPTYKLGLVHSDALLLADYCKKMYSAKSIS